MAWTLISWNVARRPACRAQVTELVARHRPDALILQETDEGWRDLFEGLGGWSRFVPGHPLKRPQDAARHEGLWIWCPAPPESWALLPLGGWPWPRTAALLRLRGGLAVAGLHLSHAPWQAKAQLRRIRGHLGGPAVILGDMNQPLAIRLAGFADRSPRTGSHRAGPLHLRLDRILATPGLSVACATPGTTCLSDHRPLVARVAPAE